MEHDRCAPEDFYSTTNHRTHVRIGEQWIETENQRMDAMIAVHEGRAFCRRLRDLRQGNRIVVGMQMCIRDRFCGRDRSPAAYRARAGGGALHAFNRRRSRRQIQRRAAGFRHQSS